MPDIKQELERLIGCKEFEEYKKENPGSYLASAFITAHPGKIEEAELEISFYSPKTEKITGFLMKESISRKKEDTVFQKEKAVVQELKMEDMKTTLEDAAETLESMRADRYPGDIPSKLIIVLQVIEDKAVWNMTILTNTLKVWNLRIDAGTLEVLKDKMESILSFKVSK
ncbi:MAG: hypothetical protein ABIB71_06330 [Candidatus Woesearchaeota archaeon]